MSELADTIAAWLRSPLTPEVEGRVRVLGERAGPALRDALASAPAAPRARAAHLLRHCDGPATVEAVARALDDRSVRVRRAAAETAGWLDAAGALDDAVARTFAAEPEPDVAAALARTSVRRLLARPRPERLDAWLACVFSPRCSAPLRRRLLGALHWLPPTEARELARRAARQLDDAAASVEPIARTLAARRAAVGPRLVRTTGAADGAAVQAATTLVWLEPRRHAELRRTLRRLTPTARSLALSGLDDETEPEVLELLVTALAEGLTGAELPRLVRVLDRLPAPEGTPPGDTAARRLRVAIHRRLAAARSRLGLDDLLRWLAELPEDTTPLELLGAVGRAGDLGVLERRLHGADAAVREAAARAMAAIAARFDLRPGRASWRRLPEPQRRALGAVLDASEAPRKPRKRHPSAARGAPAPGRRLGSTAGRRPPRWSRP